MANSNIAPGVYSSTIDKSFYTSESSVRTIMSLHTIFSPRGPDNIIVQFKSGAKEKLLEYFGTPKFSKYGQSYHTALQWAEQGYETAVCRLLPTDATYANIVLYYSKSEEELTTIKTRHDGSSETLFINDASNLKSGMKVWINDKEYEVKSVDKDEAGLGADQSVTMTATVEDTIEVGARLLLRKKEIKVKSKENANGKAQLENIIKTANANNIKNNDGVEIPFMVFYPYGRGVDYNKFSIQITKNIDAEDSYKDFAVYNLRLYDRNNKGLDILIEDLSFSFYPDALDSNGSNIDLITTLNLYSTNIQMISSDLLIKQIICDMYGLDHLTAEDYEIYPKDIFGGMNVLEDNSNGRLCNGSDGSLWKEDGTMNWGTDEEIELGDLTNATNLLRAFYNCTIDKNLLDKRWVPAKYIWDNNYPISVKLAMASLVSGQRDDIRAVLDTCVHGAEIGDLNYRDKQLTVNNCNVVIYPNNGITQDKYSNQKITVTSTYNVCKLYAKVKNTYGPHYVVGGYNEKGLMDEMASIAYSPTQEYRNQFTKKQLNTIINDPDGIYVMENITSQKETTALQQNHIADALQYIKRDTEDYARKYVLDLRLTDESLMQVKNELGVYLEKWVSNGACEWIDVQVTATALERAQQKCNCNINLKFVGIAKQINLNFIVNGEGSSKPSSTN